MRTRATLIHRNVVRRSFAIVGNFESKGDSNPDSWRRLSSISSIHRLMANYHHRHQHTPPKNSFSSEMMRFINEAVMRNYRGTRTCLGEQLSTVLGGGSPARRLERRLAELQDWNMGEQRILQSAEAVSVLAKAGLIYIQQRAQAAALFPVQGRYAGHDQPGRKAFGISQPYFPDLRRKHGRLFALDLWTVLQIVETLENRYPGLDTLDRNQRQKSLSATSSTLTIPSPSSTECSATSKTSCREGYVVISLPRNQP